MKYSFILLLFLGLFQQNIQAQNNFNSTENSPMFGEKPGHVNLEVDPQIESLLQMHTQYNQRNPQTRGLRVQIIQNTDRQLVTKEKSRFLRMYPDIRIYENYEQPFFQLRVGDFENRFDAYRVHQLLKPDFTGAFIVPDMVNVSEL